MLIQGLKFISNHKHVDSRGSFERIFDKELQNYEFEIQQVNLSNNPRKGTLRGLHFQKEGPAEHKFMKLNFGSIYIAIIDLRESSETYLNVYQKKIINENELTIFIPSGCATGWLTLENNTQITYLMTSRFQDCKYGGYRFDDPQFSIHWPEDPIIVSKTDLHWPKFKSK